MDWETLGSPWELWVAKLEQARAKFAALINAHPDEIAVVTSVSQAVSVLASAFDWQGKRNQIVVDDFSFPAVAQVWHAQAPQGARILHAPAADHIIPLEHYAHRIDDRTALVSAAHVCYRNGVKQDAAAIARLAHAQGAWMLLDAYQSLGTVPIDVKELDVDFLVGGALKYLLGSSGLAWLYVRRELIEQLTPTSGGWFTQANIFAMDIHHHMPSPTARRFEAGTPPVPNLYAGIAGLHIVEEVGMAAIAEQVQTLTSSIKANALRCGYQLATPVDPERHGALIAMRAHQVDGLVKRLEQMGVITSSRDGNLRISPHFYNSLEDVERLFAALAQHRDFLI
ncbi:MAG: aminotransferase class V-fold PLP-dependent enzyme [Anaerolineales bacterium]|nr:aminotransferase class V-fold PLP-dependent enzyme [Anaerolineales bacterium]